MPQIFPILNSPSWLELLSTAFFRWVLLSSSHTVGLKSFILLVLCPWTTPRVVPWTLYLDFGNAYRMNSAARRSMVTKVLDFSIIWIAVKIWSAINLKNFLCPLNYSQRQHRRHEFSRQPIYESHLGWAIHPRLGSWSTARNSGSVCS